MKHNYKLLCQCSQITIVTLLLFYTINTAPAQTTLPAEDIAEKTLAATVYLEMKDKNGKTLGIGSGFFVKPNLIATNYHVIEGAAKGTAKLVGKSTTYKIEGVTATDKTNDLALLKVTASGIKPLSLGDSDKVQAGETVYVTGNWKGLEGKFSNGIISRKRSENTKERLRILRGSTRGMKGLAPVAEGSSFFPGSSGCPVLNTKGEVIGVFFMTFEGGRILTFAIPSETLKKLLKQSKPVKPLSQEKQSISAETYLLWGNVKYDLYDYAGAVKDYTAAIQLKPDFVNAYINRGYANGRLQYPAASIADYIADVDTAIRLKPDNASAYYNRGIMKRRFGKYAAAVADYDTAIRLKPDYADAYLNRGVAKADLGQHTAAISDYDTAIRLKPNDAEAYLNRGLTKALLGRKLEAKQDLRTALRLATQAGDANLKTKAEKALRILNE